MPAEEMLFESGMGVDLHGADSTKAARRAVEDAVRRNSLLFMRTLGRERRLPITVDVTVGVPDPDSVDTVAVASVLPAGQITVHCETGGLAVTVDNGERIVMAVAAVIVRATLDGA